MYKRRKKIKKQKLKGSMALRKGPNPSSQTILMLDFNPILQQGNIMHKITLPISKRASLPSEDLHITDQPDVPTRHD
jgi:hypothetical protein